MKDQTIDGKLLFAQNAITNATETPEINAPLTLFGYGEPRMTEGMLLYSKASEYQSKRKKEYGEQFAATDALHYTFNIANKTYIMYIKISRIAFKGDRGLAESLQMDGARKESISGWVRQAKAFYENALNTTSVLKALEQYGINGAKLKEGQKQVLEVESSYNAQLKEMGEAQTSTQVRDAAFDDLQDWMSDFIAIARIALEEEPQRLEALGIVKKS